jgi:hypothetical protein
MGETLREAACACGQLALAVRGEPRLVGVCHCQACQRRTGSAFGAGAFFDQDQVSLTRGETKTWSRLGESGARLTFNFCPDCGSTVFWTRDSRPGLVAIGLGAFADADFPGPSRTVWTEHRHDWLDSLSELPRHPRNPA